MRFISLGFLATILALIPLRTSAQEYQIEIDSEKKVFHIDRDNVPGNMLLLDYLQTIPELSDRSRDSFIERYDIKIDGKVITEAKDAILANMYLKEVASITVSTSPSDSHIKNGVSGTVEIVPVPISKGFSGDVNLHTNGISSIIPSANFRYSDGGKFEAKANLNFDFYYPTSLSLVDTEGERYTEYGTDTTAERYLSQLARIYAKWKISDKDILRVWLWQNYMSDRMETSSFRTRIDDMSAQMGEGWQYSSTDRYSSTKFSRSLSFTTIAEYRRLLKSGELKMTADYHFYDRFPGKKDELNVELASDTRFDFSDRNVKMHFQLNSSINSNRDVCNRMYYISPMAKLSYNGKRIKASVNGRCKAYARDYAYEGAREYKGWSSDWTAEANAFWQIVDHHALRLKLIRSVGVASNDLVYPELVFDSGTKVWRKGNPNLKGPVTNSANLTYITDWKNGPHGIIFELSGEYNVQGRIIENNILYDTEKHILYTYPVNRSAGNVISMTSMLKYSYGPYSVTFGGNYFYNTELQRNKTKATYYNFQLHQSVKLKNDWLLSGTFVYHSKIYKENFTVGNFYYLNLHVSKTLGNWTLFAAVQDVFDGVTTDEERLEDKVIRTTYDPYVRQLTIGVNLNF